MKILELKKIQHNYKPTDKCPTTEANITEDCLLVENGNIKNTVNIIITRRLNSTGGNLNVPDYGATFEQCNNSILVYPAWRNLHGVTPIIPTFEGGYRNSLVFYPLKAFLNKNND